MYQTKFTRENIKLTFKKPKFYVNPERGSVRCTLTYSVAVPYDLAGFAPIFPIPSTGSVRARAVCQKGDTFDAEVGKRIAMAKAENAAYAAVRKYAKSFAQKLAPFVDAAAICLNYVYEATEHNEHNDDYIKRIGG